jgi:DNA-binding GntR family transcriptional regulator
MAFSVRAHALAREISQSPVLACHSVRVRIDPDAAEFPYEQLAAALRERIGSGEFGRGAKLPTIDQIISETGLSPMTIRRAYKVLEDEGLVVIRPGRGTYVK